MHGLELREYEVVLGSVLQVGAQGPQALNTERPERQRSDLNPKP